MKLNKTVYIAGGELEICEYDSEDLSLSGIWITIFIISVALNVFAIIGNLIVIAACFLQKHRPPLIIYIHALAFSDLFYALVAPLYTYRYALQHWPTMLINFELTANLARYIASFGNTFATISSYLVVALTIDRLILTRMPSRAARLSTAGRAYLAIGITALLSAAFNAVWFYELLEVDVIIYKCSGFYQIPKSVTEADGSVYIPVRYRSEYQLYNIICSILLFYALPTLIMIVCNVLILLKFKSNAARALEDGAEPEDPSQMKRKAEEMRLTKMIVVVSIVFMICNLPDLITRLLWKFIHPVTVGKVQPIAHLFLIINVGANFIVYSLFNKHLFETIKQLCRQYCGCLFINRSKASLEEKVREDSRE